MLLIRQLVHPRVIEKKKNGTSMHVWSGTVLKSILLTKTKNVLLLLLSWADREDEKTVATRQRKPARVASGIMHNGVHKLSLRNF
jgi:hypothetical protein